MIELMHFVL